MKKHQIDDLFKEKLSKLERQPSARTWEKIQEGQKKNERRLVGWIWYAAAGVLLALGVGYSVWINEGNNSKPEIAVIIKPKPATVPAKEIPRNITNDKKEALANLGKPVSSGKIDDPKDKTVSNIEIGKKVENKEKGEKPTTTIGEQLAIIKPSVEESQANATIAIKSPVAEVDQVQDLTVAALTEKNENRTIVVKVDVPDENPEKRKTSRFSKIFRQLKNVKDGESVNWEDVGFNPKTVVARVDERLRHGEEKVSGKYQDIKERTKL